MEETWFIVGAALFMAAGGGHALAAVFDVVRPTFFTPVDDRVRATMETTTFRFRRMWPFADDVSPSMWRLWLGFNVSHGVGAFTFGLFCVLLASHDYALVERIGAVQPLTIAFAATYFVLALRFWFYVPAAITGGATVCFAVAALAG